MSKFLISRTAKGVCFSLVADNGRRLAVSRTYATLDACKKGIASLIVNAPAVPLVDSSAGEYGANPKFELVDIASGFGFLLKSANGKSVITSPRYATKKACLRAIAMLRNGVTGAAVFLQQDGASLPVVMTAHLAAVGITAPEASAPKPAFAAAAAPHSEAATPRFAARNLEKNDEISDGYDAVCVDDDAVPKALAADAGKGSDITAVTPTAPAAAPKTAEVPRLVRLQPTNTPAKRPVKKVPPVGRKASATPAGLPQKLLDLLFKRK